MKRIFVWEFKEKRIESAKLIPDHEIKSHTETELPDKSALTFKKLRRFFSEKETR